MLAKIYKTKFIEAKEEEMKHEVESCKEEGKESFFAKMRQLFTIYGRCVLVGVGL